MKSTDVLNEAQRSAVMVTSGPLLILAGAGSGKTKTLTHRIARLIAHEHVLPSRILAVTFTNKAAREMRERLARELQADPSDRSFMPWTGTFHSICVRLLRRDGQQIGIPANFVIYDEDDRRSIIKRAMKELQLTDKDVKPSAASSMISAEKNKLVTPEELADSATYPFQQMLAKLYGEYERQRIAAKALDFDDLLIEVVRLLRTCSEVRAQWQQHFTHILIDEYQDTNAAQYTIVKLLVNDQRNICVVGDDWQSIYSWRGADFTNILNFERDFPGAVVVKLEQNYRSTAAILEAAQSVISKNTERTDKILWTDSGHGIPVHVQSTYDETEEAAVVADRIAAQVAIQARSYDDFAVLYRTNAQSYSIERALRQRFIPSQIVGGMRFFDRAVIKDIMAYVRLCYQPSDAASFLRIANVPTRGVGATSLEKFLAWQRVSGMDIITALTNVEQTSSVTARARAALEKLGDTLRLCQVRLSDTPPAEAIQYIIDSVGYKDFINDGSPQAEEKMENIGALISEAKPYADIDTFLEEAALMSSVDTSTDQGAVTLMTIHAAKGLEFPVVCMVGMEEGIFPHSRVFDGKPAELEEERRLCYVGMTRAREELYLSYAMSRSQFGQRSYNDMSRFITDMGAVTSVAQDAVTMDDVFYPDELLLDCGDRVKSTAFGQGTVTDIDGLAVTIEFDSGQTKKLNAEYARLEKISP
jgi:DNA helicase-2/ATP-dependent DNA helicase PcrA